MSFSGPAPDASSPTSSTTETLTSQTSQIARFLSVQVLGKGAQGFVQLSYDSQNQQQIAVKYIHREFARKYSKYVLRELKTHSSLSSTKHPHIVEFLEVFLTPNYLGIAMEYVNSKDLQYYLEKHGGRVPEDIARFLFQQLIIAVDFCHRQGKVNRDIKLANILVSTKDSSKGGQTPPLIKLCDFGFAKDLNADSIPQTQLGTALFSAPEIFGIRKGQYYDAKAADLWSCGVVLYMMLFGSHPFVRYDNERERNRSEQMMQLIENSMKGNMRKPAESNTMPEAMDLVKRLLQPDANQRATMADIMHHPWFLNKLPEGALHLNDLYLAPESYIPGRQTPQEIESLVTRAFSEGGPAHSSAATSTTFTGGVSQSHQSMPSMAAPMRQQHRHPQQMMHPSPALPASPSTANMGSVCGPFSRHSQNSQATATNFAEDMSVVGYETPAGAVAQQQQPLPQQYYSNAQQVVQHQLPQQQQQHFYSSAQQIAQHQLLSQQQQQQQQQQQRAPAAPAAARVIAPQTLIADPPAMPAGERYGVKTLAAAVGGTPRVGIAADGQVDMNGEVDPMQLSQLDINGSSVSTRRNVLFDSSVLLGLPLMGREGQRQG